MADAACDLSRARILITNDDGIHAPGLKVLERVAYSLSDDVWTVAPEVEQSATSHSLTTRRPLRLRSFGERRTAVDGTPTDCVMVAVKNILQDRPPDIVLSGINHGANLAEDVVYSGTVAAAMEGAMLGIPAIAFSQLRRGDEPADFAPAEHFAAEVIRKLYGMAWMRDLLMNVNFPALPVERIAGVRVCRQGRRDATVGVVEGRDPGGRPYLWIGDWAGNHTTDLDTDLAAVAAGAISVTPLLPDLTHGASLKALESQFR